MTIIIECIHIKQHTVQ